MRIRQYVYLAIFSRVHTPEQLAALIGIEPDEVSKNVPWSLYAAEPQRVDDAIEELLARLDDRARTAIGAVGASADCRVSMQVVRYFNDVDGEEEKRELRADGLVVLSGQHQALGFGLSRALLDGLAQIRASINCDEYG